MQSRILLAVLALPTTAYAALPIPRALADAARTPGTLERRIVCDVDLFGFENTLCAGDCQHEHDESSKCTGKCNKKSVFCCCGAVRER
jgi:hypothetical protein